jgi:hypothetical protein
MAPFNDAELYAEEERQPLEVDLEYYLLHAGKEIDAFFEALNEMGDLP